MTDAVILAGGQGRRLRSEVPDLPKPLADVNGRPFLDILLRQLEGAARVRKVVFAVGYLAERIIERYKGAEFAFETGFSTEDEPLGTGGALIKASRLTDSEEILVMNGDSFVEADIDDLISFHRESGAPFTVVLKEVEDTGRYGRVEVNGECRLVSFGEKRARPGPGLINAGVYVFERELLRDETERKVSLEEGLLPEYIRYGGYGFVVHGKFIDIGVPEAYRAAAGYLRGVCAKTALSGGRP